MLSFFWIKCNLRINFKQILIEWNWNLFKVYNLTHWLHKQRVFTQDWLNSFWIAVAFSFLPFTLHGKQSIECTWRRMSLPLRNLYKCKQVACSVVVACLLVYPLFYTELCCCMFSFESPFFILMLLLLVYFFIPIFILMLLLYFCLYVDNLNKPIIFVFGAFF